MSWPNLAKALGKAGPKQTVFPQDWAVLYLGSGIHKEGKPKPRAPQKEPRKDRPQLIFVDKKGAPLRNFDAQSIVGLVVLDGTWSQAKALWWRNPWLLKLRRAILIPSSPSLYGKLRREPRRECLSTIESIADSLLALGESEGISNQLRQTFQNLLLKFEGQKRHRNEGNNPKCGLNLSTSPSSAVQDDMENKSPENSLGDGEGKRD